MPSRSGVDDIGHIILHVQLREVIIFTNVTDFQTLRKVVNHLTPRAITFGLHSAVCSPETQCSVCETDSMSICENW